MQLTPKCVLFLSKKKKKKKKKTKTSIWFHHRYDSFLAEFLKDNVMLKVYLQAISKLCLSHEPWERELMQTSRENTIRHIQLRKKQLFVLRDIWVNVCTYCIESICSIVLMFVWMTLNSSVIAKSVSYCVRAQRLSKLNKSKGIMLLLNQVDIKFKMFFMYVSYIQAYYQVCCCY